MTVQADGSAPEWAHDLARAVSDQLDELAARIGKSAQVKNVAQLSANARAGDIAYVPDESGGPAYAVYDGTDWRRLTLGAVVS